MKQRLNYYPQFPAAFEKMAEIETLLKTISIDHEIVHLVKIRASQLNGCTFCLDMHTKEAKISGVRELKLFHVSAWHESQLFSDKERAALEWTEALTKLSQAHVSDEVYTRTREFFSEKEIVELSVAIAMINAWNRFGAGFRSTPGSLDKAYGLDKAGL